MTDLSPYRDIDWDAMAEEEEKALLDPKEAARQAALPKSRTLLLKAEGGPFDGMELNVPPGGSEVVLPAAYGDGDMKGKVIYRRKGNVMEYIGQPEQIPDDEDDDD
jgi:hypothetical protein